MYLLVNVLEQPEHLVAILEGFAKIGIKGSTVMNSTGMGRVLMQAGTNGPAMEKISEMIANGESSNKTIFTVVKEKKNFWIKPSTSSNRFAVTFASQARGYYLRSRWPMWMVCLERIEHGGYLPVPFRDINHVAKIGLIP